MSIAFMRSITRCDSFFFLTSVCMKNSMTNAALSVSQYARKNGASANEDGDDDASAFAATRTRDDDAHVQAVLQDVLEEHVLRFLQAVQTANAKGRNRCGSAAFRRRGGVGDGERRAIGTASELDLPGTRCGRATAPSPAPATRTRGRPCAAATIGASLRNTTCVTFSA